jgi:hypothetical protein
MEYRHFVCINACVYGLKSGAKLLKRQETFIVKKALKLINKKKFKLAMYEQAKKLYRMAGFWSVYRYW